MSTLALKVVSPSPAAPLGRQNLVAALARREETLKAYQAASAAVDRLRGLIDEETKAKAALAALEEDPRTAPAHGREATSRRLKFHRRRQLTARGVSWDVRRGWQMRPVERWRARSPQRLPGERRGLAAVTQMLESLHEILYEEAVKIRKSVN